MSIQSIEPYKIVKTNINDVRTGDTIWHKGIFKTISKNNLSYWKYTDYHTGSPITHTVIDGDCFMLGIEPVELVLYPRYCEGKFIGYGYGKNFLAPISQT